MPRKDIIFFDLDDVYFRTKLSRKVKQCKASIGVCYKTLATIWKLPFGDEVCATCAAIALCLGALLQISTAKYNKQNNDLG